MPKRLTYSFVKQAFKKEGYILINKKYINSTSKLEYLCPKGHSHSITWGDFSQGHRCAYCSNSVRFEYSYVKNIFESKGCTLISTEYVNSSTKLDYICASGHTHSICWNDFKKGYGCRLCGFKKLSQPGHKHWNWQGGLSAEPYCKEWIDKEYRQAIKDRDYNICQNPYCYRKKYKKSLSIHHINYNKIDCRINNLITLCTGCNNRANKDRPWHQEWYQLILTKRFGYRYDK